MGIELVDSLVMSWILHSSTLPYANFLPCFSLVFVLFLSDSLLSFCVLAHVVKSRFDDWLLIYITKRIYTVCYMRWFEVNYRRLSIQCSPNKSAVMQLDE